MRRRFFFILLFCILTVIPFFSAQASEKPFVVQLTDTGFSPTAISIPLDSIIRFENSGEYTYLPVSFIEPSSGIFPALQPKEPILPKKSWSFRLTQEGTWKLQDKLHPEFTMQIVVTPKKMLTMEKEKDNYVDWNFRNMFDYVFWAGKIASYRVYYAFFKESLEKEFDGKNIYIVVDSKNELEFWLATIGPVAVMDKLKNTAGDGSELQCHRQAHAVGRGAYMLFGLKAFADGDTACSSGFYHGVIEAYMREKKNPDVQAELLHVCGSFSKKFEQFQCYHGAGHGILSYYDYNLPKALEVCRTLQDENGKVPCLGGVFMENVVVAMTKRTANDHHTSWLSINPHYPCNTLDKYPFVQQQCYQMQTSWMLYLFDGNYDAVLAECSRAPKQAIASCYRSFGRDLGFSLLRDPKKIMPYCNKLANNTENYSACVTGGLYAVLEYWGYYLQDQGESFCQTVLPIGQKQCYQEVVKRKKTLGMF